VKERICVDQDHVLADLITPWVDRYNNTYNDTLNVSDITMWDWHVLTRPECGKKIYQMLTPDMFENLPVIHGSQEIVKKLTEKYDVFIVTAARNASVIPAKAKWIKTHFPFIKRENVVYAVNKSICLADSLIDDAPHNLETFKGDNKLLFDASHNKDENRFKRVKNWNDIANFFGV
jgi:5'(3')-deoxyribonucleotidase